MSTKHKTMYDLTESIAYEDTSVLGIYSDKMDTLSDAHDAAHENQTGYYDDYDTSHWSNDSRRERVELRDITWTVAPTEVQ